MVALRRYGKRKNKNQPQEEDNQMDVEHISTEDREIYDLRQLMEEGQECIIQKQETGRDQFRTYEYQKHNRKLNASNTKITVWLEHPNTKYTRDIRARCIHGIRCKGTRSLTSTKVCTALHPFEWEMFSDNYIQYIKNLPTEPLENINENVLPKWTSLTSLKSDTIQIKTG
jgi:hypothetical protein